MKSWKNTIIFKWAAIRNNNQYVFIETEFINVYYDIPFCFNTIHKLEIF